MGAYITTEYLVEVCSEQAVKTVIAARITKGTTFALTDLDVVVQLDRAIASAESIAESKLGRRFSGAELDGLQDEDVIRQCIARIAIYELAPSAMPRSEELRADRDRKCKHLVEIGKRLASAGRSDPDPPPNLSTNVCTLQLNGLNYLYRV